MLTVTFKVHNYGHSAAQRVRIFPELTPYSVSNTGKCDDSKAGKYFGDVIMPEQDIDHPWGVAVARKDVEDAIRRQNPTFGRKLLLTLSGCIVYFDDPSEKTPHHTAFSYTVTTHSGNHLIDADANSIPVDDISLESMADYFGPTD
jgi:hypothetical protein